jgi:hypothetical protein
MSRDELVAEVAALRQRVAALEKTAFAAPEEYVEGWTAAAKVVGVTERTCRRRFAAGDFCQPCKISEIKRADGEHHERLTWRRRDLVAYAEGR